MAEAEVLKIKFGDDIHPIRSEHSNVSHRKLSISEKVSDKESVDDDLEAAQKIATEDRNRRKKQASISHVTLFI